MDDGDGDHILRANAKDANGLDCVGGPHCDRAAKAARSGEPESVEHARMSPWRHEVRRWSTI